MADDSELTDVAATVYDAIRLVRDPEKDATLEDLNVVSEEGVTVTRFNEDKYLIAVEFVPTISHCSLATLIGLCIRVKLTRALPFPFKADIHLAPGSHDTEHEVSAAAGGMASGRGWQRDLKTPGERLALLLGSPKFSDIELVFPNNHGSIKAHRVVLAMSSPVFEDSLYGSRAAGRTLRIYEDHPEAFAWMLGYMYCNSKGFPSLSLAIEVSHLADKYQMGALATHCSQFLENNLNEKNLSEIYNAAVSLKNSSLLQLCSKVVRDQTSTIFLEPNFVKLSQDALLHLLQTTLYVSSEVKVFRAVVTWGKHQIDNRRAMNSEATLRREIEPLLPHIRFLSMSTDEFVTHVMPSGVLTSDESTAILLAIKETGNHHDIPSICCIIKEKRERFDKTLIKRLLLPDMSMVRINSHAHTYEDHILIANLKASKTIHLHQVDCKTLKISSMIATIKDPGQQVVRVLTSTGPTGVFESGITLHPGMRCSVTVSVVGRWQSVLHHFTCNHDGVIFEGERLISCKSPLVLHYWHFSE
ncbi:uncharacterized protein LOC122247247 isoform X2 [Penaeus japonicus]|nr:uncharacterized protein LOC122247247 isoform X2 [Penaeus japonicus]XP_042862300.1 uncharacterized protein LOC122247247 isoform X2 [Penaeus japonicus]XP_042862310.1 uncharacterized protein LOC122247247 isoform X2 [Penaeus japonicus]XP_042862320.1 uncharacterized protein LOC122247247 isoform X2 [Penaeus japonicus]XP_042862329.1 uncharacterized protein LOC122247247 isoform X2 [Penaeus japonicus]XP_042862337.1 uncharacterized protein LOC122247247 isoform X2 [Penaeus japonicus]